MHNNFLCKRMHVGLHVRTYKKRFIVSLKKKKSLNGPLENAMSAHNFWMTKREHINRCFTGCRKNSLHCQMAAVGKKQSSLTHWILHVNRFEKTCSKNTTAHVRGAFASWPCCKVLKAYELPSTRKSKDLHRESFQQTNVIATNT
jgi:hypothetical protein